MRTFFLAMLVAALSPSTVLADPASRPKLDYATAPDPLPPAKRAAGEPCAAFGPGFVKAEGTDTCLKVGGSFQADVSGAARAR
jgi:Porin subfamily